MGQSGRARSGVRVVFGIPEYRRLWAARTVSQLGDTFNVVALALLVFHLTGSGVGVSGVVVAEVVPVLALSPVAGALVDRWPRVAVMVIADLFRAALMVLLMLWHSSVPGVYGIAIAMSAGSVFFNPAAGSLLPALVSRKALVAANSGIWTAAVLSQIVLAPAAGLLVTSLGYAPAFAINAASFLIDALILARLQTPSTPEKLTRRRLWSEAAEGVGVVIRHHILRALAVGQLLAALSAGATSALLVVLARVRLGVSGQGYGILIGVIGIGAAAGPLVLLRLIRRPESPILVFAPFAVRGIVDLVLATVTSLPLAAVALIGYGIGTSTGAVTFNSMLQAQAPEQARGRVFATMDVLWQAGRLASLAAGGFLADQYGIRVVYYLGGALLIAAASAGFLPPAGQRSQSDQ